MRAVFGGYDDYRWADDRDMLLTESTWGLYARPELDCRWFDDLVEHSPRMAAKVPRCRPDLFTDADIVVWLDGHLEVLDGRFVDDCVTALGDRDVAVFRHPFLTTITAEAHLAATLPKYNGWDLTGQARRYLTAGHPDNWGLWATGVMVRRPATTRTFGDRWQAEIDRWGPEDQISLPPVLRACGITPVDLPAWWWCTRFRLHPHADGTR